MFWQPPQQQQNKPKKDMVINRSLAAQESCRPMSDTNSSNYVPTNMSPVCLLIKYKYGYYG